MFSSAFDCVFVSKQDYAKTTHPVFTKFGGKVTHFGWPAPMALAFRQPSIGIFAISLTLLLIVESVYGK